MRIPVDKTKVSVKHSLNMCGLCSEKSDSFVDITMELRVFLRTFLSPPNPEYDLPYKLCLKCYKTTSEAKGFKDKSNTAMLKLLKEGRRDLYSKDDRRPKILIDWKDKHLAEKTFRRMTRKEKPDSEEVITMVDISTENNVPATTNNEKSSTTNNEKSSVNEQPEIVEQEETKSSADSAANVPRTDYSSSVQEITHQVPDTQQEINAQFTDAMEIVGHHALNEEEAKLIEVEETFAATGPYQCELCDAISETKEEFLNDIRTKHVSEIDQDVLDALEKDIKIRAAKRKAGVIS